MRIGSLFSGYGGLDMACEAHFGATTAWVSDVDKGANKILAHRYPDVPNIGDITKVDWAAIEPVEVLTGGFPCQDLSHAGKRAGMRPDTRSGLWTHMAYALDQLRPRYVVAENVRGLLSAAAHSSVEPCPWCVGGAGDGEPDLRALGAVLGDLADLGYDAQWVGLRAADVGAPHGRFRVFIVAEDTDSAAGREWRLAAPGQAEGGRSRTNAGRRGRASATDALGGRLDGRPSDALWGSVGGAPAAGGGEVAGTTSDAGSQRHGRGQDGREVGRLDSHTEGEARERERAWAEPGDRSAANLADASSDAWRIRNRDDLPSVWNEPQWGAYEPAIHRWERTLGRVAPPPTETSPKGSQRLSPAFVEWMMGLDQGWVTDVPGLTRNEQLKALGNGVVPQQAYAALGMMLGTQAVAA